MLPTQHITRFKLNLTYTKLDGLFVKSRTKAWVENFLEFIMFSSNCLAWYLILASSMLDPDREDTTAIQPSFVSRFFGFMCENTIFIDPRPMLQI